MIETANVVPAAPPHARRNRRIVYELCFFVLFAAGRTAWYMLPAHSDGYSQYWDPPQIAANVMLLGAFGMLLPLFLWCKAEPLRFARVWVAFLLAAIICGLVAQAAPEPAWPLSHYGLSPLNLAHTGLFLSINSLVWFPLGAALRVASERVDSDLVRFPSRGARIPNKPTN